jgi:carboxymethylenebutenolidase
VFVFYDVGPPGVTQGPDRFGKANPPAPVDRIDVPVYGFYPERDLRATNSVPATKEAMSAAGKTFEAVVYTGAEHAYMRLGSDPADHNPANAAAVKASYTRLKALLDAL